MSSRDHVPIFATSEDVCFLKLYTQLWQVYKQCTQSQERDFAIISWHRERKEAKRLLQPAITYNVY